jgi:hypothetical protein
VSYRRAKPTASLLKASATTETWRAVACPSAQAARPSANPTESRHLAARLHAAALGADRRGIGIGHPHQSLILLAALRAPVFVQGHSQSPPS